MWFNPDLVIIELESESREDVLLNLGNQLVKGGYVKGDFIESVLARESNFPTGLPTKPFGIAIPHTDADKVIDPQLAFASLKTPVTFNTMGSANEEIEVKLVFMLALNNPEEQLKSLQRLTEIFQDEEMVLKLSQAKNAEEVNELMESSEKARF
ncbi:PTS sugar transporter subunit IIA [Virgibacillus oceani]|uniref:PTS galactitol transporter subunit IIA n=1 Tax=Virgibacillus oceani TaxID=1479511 RepID=A0A917HBX5_9BACI|nr:PTS sugar transporter subunit IIA [Virgibacillus oceani]GGG73604.1 PTS galactitol transporter subunit IIA [Virgibacillus oceani]